MGIGATGRTGTHVIQQLLGTEHHQPKVFAFCRTPTKLNQKLLNEIDGVFRGDARSSKDIQNALKQSNADLVIVSVGNGDDVKKTDIRTANAKALTKALAKSRFSHVKAVIVSSGGAGKSKIIVGFGIGKIISFHLRHILADHNGQEGAIAAKANVEARTFIVRPSALTEGKPTGKVGEFADGVKQPTLKTDREDLAKWVVSEVISKGASKRFGGNPANVTGIRAN